MPPSLRLERLKTGQVAPEHYLLRVRQCDINDVMNLNDSDDAQGVDVDQCDIVGITPTEYLATTSSKKCASLRYPE